MLSVVGFKAHFPGVEGFLKTPASEIKAALLRSQCWLDTLLGRSECDKEPYYLLAAHFILWAKKVASGGVQFGTVTSGTEGSVSFSVQAPQNKTEWQAWLAGTPYGQALLAWLSLKSVGAWSIGGLPERSAFRKVGGVFW